MLALTLRLKDNIRGPQVLHFLQHLHRMFPGPIVLVWDLGRSHRAAVVRQWLDGGVQPWRTRLVGVEGFATYRSPCWDLYDEVVVSSIERFLETNADLRDAILLLDVLEHFEHAEGEAILSVLRSRLSPGGRLFGRARSRLSLTATVHFTCQLRAADLSTSV